MRARWTWLRESPASGEPGAPHRSGWGGWGLGQNPQPEVPFPPAESLFAGGRGAPGMFEA